MQGSNPAGVTFAEINPAYYTEQAQLRARLCICLAYTV